MFDTAALAESYFRWASTWRASQGQGSLPVSPRFYGVAVSVLTSALSPPSNYVLLADKADI